MWKVFRFFKDDPNDEQLLGTYETLRKAKSAAADDKISRERYRDLIDYRYEELEENLTQEQVDMLLRRLK